jgi:DNA-binding NarL/FixJ family response regulator
VSTEAFILVVDDHPLFREGIVALLGRRIPGARFAEASSGHEALRQVDDTVDLVLSDYRLPDIDGLTLLSEVGRRHPSIARVLVSGVNDSGLVESAVALGLVGFLAKTMDAAELSRAVQQILGGHPYFPSAAVAQSAFTLTKRQREIIRWASLGLSNKEIAHELGISERTVKEHMGLVFQRLGAANRAEAIACAAARGLLHGQ